MNVKRLLPYLTLGVLLYWWLNRQQPSAQTPEQIAYAKSLPSDLYL